MWKDCKLVGFSTFWTQLFTCSRAAKSAEWKGRLQCYDTPFYMVWKVVYPFPVPLHRLPSFFSQDRPKGAQSLVSVHCLTGSIMFARSFFFIVFIWDRTVNGEPSLSVKPPSTQKYVKNRQAGGGGFIPATLRIEGRLMHQHIVLQNIRETLKECENAEEICVEMM